MNILKFFIQLILFLLLPGVIFTLIASKTPILGGIQSFVVLTGSMEPTLPVGSLTYIKPSGEYQKGDIIAFKNVADQSVTHRIVERFKDFDGYSFRTRGDANNTEDREIVKNSDVLGKSLFMIPFIGYLINFLKTPFGFSALIVFPTTVFIVFELWNFRKEFEKHMEKKILEKMQARTQI